MKKVIAIAALVLFAFQFSYAQIPVEQYRKEIQNLKTEAELKAYWEKLVIIDQVTVKSEENILVADSIFIDNMVHMALLVEELKDKALKPNMYYSVMLVSITLIHSQASGASLAYWPVIQEYKQYVAMYKYPAYQLEGEILGFYNYSMLGRDAQYPKALTRLNSVTDSKNVIANLLAAFEYDKKLRKLTTVKVLNTWNVDSGLGINEEDVFTFRKMSDGNLYVESRSNLQKLNLVTTKGNTKIYRIENEPMGWTYKYEANGNLSLLDENNKTLVAYTKATVN